jgi:hypothetical protein
MIENIALKTLCLSATLRETQTAAYLSRCEKILNHRGIIENIALKLFASLLLCGRIKNCCAFGRDDETASLRKLHSQ